MLQVFVLDLFTLLDPQRRLCVFIVSARHGSVSALIVVFALNEILTLQLEQFHLLRSSVDCTPVLVLRLRMIIEFYAVVFSHEKRYVLRSSAH